MLLGEIVEDIDAAWGELSLLIEFAMTEVNRMRVAEGEELTVEVQRHIEGCGHIIQQLRGIIPQEQMQLTERTIQRVRLLAGQVEISQERIAQEIGLLAERMDVTEELARLDSHLVQFGKFASSQKPIGRELDFLLQEMMREVNTLLSKMHAATVVNLGVSLKAEIEKIREQIQNLE
jgi:uncharacterized protein (TIGR00255 family)